MCPGAEEEERVPPSIPPGRQIGSSLSKGCGGSGSNFFFFCRNPGIHVNRVGLGFSGSRMRQFKPLLNLSWDDKGLSELDWPLVEQEHSFCSPAAPALPCHYLRKGSRLGHNPAVSRHCHKPPQPPVWDSPLPLFISSPPGKKIWAPLPGLWELQEGH